MSRGLRARIAGTSGGLAEMGGQERQELPQVPSIGLDGLGRQPALLGEAAQPCRRFAPGIGGHRQHRVEKRGWRLVRIRVGAVLVMS